ncbi:MAG: hypothetical protein J1F64_06220 [Oscillospiraceae bacterium]|nr:hypothetical protein [Oscillospiraceae bacterium]
MKSPKDMRIIQIDVTNACIHQCSNCTRFCGHHKKNFFMDFETFKRAVDSLDGYVGTIGIMGGEPTLNPEFERMAEYLAGKKPKTHTDDMLRPQQHFMDAIHDLEAEHTFAHPCLGGVRQTIDGPGLWSAIGENYKKYYETIQDTIQYQALNDHTNTMYHQPGLVSRKSLGIPDDKWIELRNNCWVQNLWSASITPKGAFFCELAGALDMLFDGPGGWPVEPGWWKRTPEEFGDQLHWCELCGLACETFMRDANEEVYDVSPDVYEKLERAGSRLIGTDRINILKIDNGVIAEESKAEISRRFSESMPYTESYSARFNEEKTNLLFKKIIGLFIADENSVYEKYIKCFDKFNAVYVYGENDLSEKIKENYKGKTEVNFINAKEKLLGKVIYDILHEKDHNKYLMTVKGDVELKNVTGRLNKLVLNPGTLLYSEICEHTENDYFNCGPGSEVSLFNGTAHSIRDAGWDKILQMTEIKQIKDVWQNKKIFEFKPETERKAPTTEIKAGERIVIYGAGRNLNRAVENVKANSGKIVAVTDGSSDKIGTNICGYEVRDPKYLKENRNDYDKVFITTMMYYREMKKRVTEQGIKESDIIWM